MVRIIARIDVKPPYVVKPVHYEGLRKIGDPAEICTRYYAAGADEIFYNDIVASLYRRPLILSGVEQASEGIFIPFTAGGGVTSIEDFSSLFHCGADKVSINTYALQEQAEIIDEASRIFGAQSVVVHIEAKQQHDGWECYSDCGRIPSGKKVLQWAKEAESRGAGEIILSSVDTDGRMRGFDSELVARVCESVSIPVIAASGAGSVEDVVELVRTTGVSGVAIGSLLHYDKGTIREIKERINPVKSVS